MDLIHNFQEYAAERQSSRDAMVNKTCNSDVALAPPAESESSQGSFDCNICFDLAHDPVVTLCGHLYCWACIFKWLHVQSSSSQPTQQKTCPVCKANISQTSLIPLYCHGPSRSEDEVRKSQHDVIPPRPAANSPSSQHLPSNPFESQHPEFRYASISSSNYVSPTMAGILNPTIGLLGELVYTRMLGSTGTNLFTSPRSNSYAIVGHNNPRMRRQELQLDKSLDRVSKFLLCCVVLCLLLF
ncbi:E3 ubiquitin-protein ligase RMA3-like [Chenopodium quinoa]|uniref:E3 ubiquitin-protein ligase RMA3-like n=1 Tax=Chenopodium quinoa TaxID=63459 RepID=UPI000B774A2E|nr:E3 ubiquitin-protein ligase RMA3-like [Chenopodium quinoa]XP_021726120.1 E3 ubiquitin-protein ligase RMA3-like [Chenopodium quinoa]